VSGSDLAGRLHDPGGQEHRGETDVLGVQSFTITEIYIFKTL